MIKTLKDAVVQHDLMVSKRILLDQTLCGAVDALAQSLSTVQPLFFGRAQRVRRLANGLAGEVNLIDSWRVGVAAIFSQLAYLSIPSNLSRAVYYNEDLGSEGKAMVLDLPKETQKILNLIPGLEDIGKILQRVDVQPQFEVDDGSGIRTAASILRLSLDYDYYHEQGHSDSRIIETFKARPNVYDLKMVDALGIFLRADTESFSSIEIETQNLAEGMRLEEDLLLEDSMLIASAGTDIDRSILKTIRNYISLRRISISEKIRVMNPVA